MSLQHSEFFYDEGHNFDMSYPITDAPKPLRENNKNSCGLNATSRKEKKLAKYIHVPHRNKPPQVVAKRNARERRRVQAVNSAFVRLRKAVPFENHRGKRVSKVKTLQYAIDYIEKLQQLLNDCNYNYQHDYTFHETSNQSKASCDSAPYDDLFCFNNLY